MSNTSNTMSFDRARLVRLRRAYSKAAKDGRVCFTFEGREFVTAYAKYVIEYLSPRLAPMKGERTHEEASA